MQLSHSRRSISTVVFTHPFSISSIIFVLKKLASTLRRSARRRQDLMLMLVVPPLPIFPLGRGWLPILKSDDWLLLFVRRVRRHLKMAIVDVFCSPAIHSTPAVSDRRAVLRARFAFEELLGDRVVVVVVHDETRGGGLSCRRRHFLGTLSPL